MPRASNKEDYALIADQLRKLCAQAVDVEPGAFGDAVVLPGSWNFKSLAKGWTKLMKDKLVEAAAWFFTHFQKNGVAIKTHPLFTDAHIDIARFDPTGDKDESEGLDWEVGPAGDKEMYFQPATDQMWRRFGLAVLGKFANGDAWLHPFQDPGNWWRAYHGTDAVE